MKWEAPKIEEVSVALEITEYMPAEF
ncbi:pyrroloquinoline quinone precursor peptide PqqA [Cernens ardua]